MFRVSIITINKNNSKGLLATINSVINQSLKSLEYIIIDGYSTDGSVEIIKNYEDYFTSWISEPDNGIYHAMNKGIAIAKGEYLLFLNSGDTFYEEDTLQKIFEQPQTADILYGDTIYDWGNKTIYNKMPPLTPNYMFLKGTIVHQSSLIKKALFDKIGGYNEHNKICSDWEWFLKALYHNNATTQYFDFPFSVFNADGLSADPENTTLIKGERMNILKDSFPEYVSSLVIAFDEMKQKYNALYTVKPVRWVYTIYTKPFVRKILGWPYYFFKSLKNNFNAL